MPADFSTGAVGTVVTFIRGTWDLLRADGVATTWTGGLWLLKAALGIVPTVALYRRLRRLWRLLLLPLLPILFLQSLLSLRACPTLWQWLALIVCSIAGVWLVRIRWLPFAVLLPFIVLVYVPGLEHANGTWWHGRRLAERCAANDGKRPANLTADLIAPVYFGLESFPDGAWLLTSHRGSANTVIGSVPLLARTDDPRAYTPTAQRAPGTTWLRRRGPADFELAEWAPMAPDGHYWLGCRVGDQLWFPTGSRCLSSVAHDPAAGGTRVHEQCTEGLDDLEFSSACDSAGGKVYFKKFGDGALIQLTTATGEVRHHKEALAPLGGALARRDRDGMLLVATVPELNTYSPTEERVLSRIGAGLVPMWISVCQADGTAAVTDFAGRLRIFALDQSGAYRFDWGINLFAPRAVSFSPDCSHLVVGSADDRHVWLINGASRSIQATYNVGPSVRRVSFVSNNEVAVVDACTVSSFLF